MGRPLHPSPGLWSARPRSLRPTQRRVPQWYGLLLVGPFLLAPFTSSLAVWAYEWLIPTMVLGIVLFMGLALYWNLSEFFALRVTPADRAFSDSPAGLVEFGVEVTLYNANRPLGVDRGFVWIEDGILTFNGAACSFALASNDLRRRDAKRERFLRDVPNEALRLNIPGQAAYVRFVPLHAPRGMTFEYWLGRFLASVDQSARPRQWPPLHPYDVSPVPPIPKNLANGA